jgi:hypothetical protein
MAADPQTENRIRKLERELAALKRRVDEMARLLKRASDPEVQRAGRRGS